MMCVRRFLWPFRYWNLLTWLLMFFHVILHAYGLQIKDFTAAESTSENSMEIVRIADAFVMCSNCADKSIDGRSEIAVQFKYYFFGLRTLILLECGVQIEKRCVTLSLDSRSLTGLRLHLDTNIGSSVTPNFSLLCSAEIIVIGPRVSPVAVIP